MADKPAAVLLPMTRPLCRGLTLRMQPEVGSLFLKIIQIWRGLSHHYVYMTCLFLMRYQLRLLR